MESLTCVMDREQLRLQPLTCITLTSSHIVILPLLQSVYSDTLLYSMDLHWSPPLGHTD